MGERGLEKGFEAFLGDPGVDPGALEWVGEPVSIPLGAGGMDMPLFARIEGVPKRVGLRLTFVLPYRSRGDAAWLGVVGEAIEREEEPPTLFGSPFDACLPLGVEKVCLCPAGSGYLLMLADELRPAPEGVGLLDGEPEALTFDADLSRSFC